MLSSNLESLVLIPKKSKDNEFLERILPETTVGNVFSQNPKMTARNVNVFYDKKQAINDVTIDISEKEVIALIGPSGCGKSTFLRCLNRMNDTISSCKVEGDICMIFYGAT